MMQDDDDYDEEDDGTGGAGDDSEADGSEGTSVETSGNYHVVVRNFTGNVLEASDTLTTFHLPSGESRIVTPDEQLTFQRFDSSTFDAPLNSSRTVITVSDSAYDVIESQSFYENFGIGVTVGIVIMFTALAMRAVKQLGYHSQDI